jgi:DNA-binding MarR family transcriptional regulator
MHEDDDHWMSAWLLLLRTHTRLWERVESHMRREHGITVARFDVLTQLNMAGGRLGLSDLAASLLLSPSGLSKLLDRMDASGLIVREPDPDDARASFARLTAKGRRLVTRARTSHHDLVRHLFGDVLNEHDVADLARVLSKIQAGLNTDAT